MLFKMVIENIWQNDKHLFMCFQAMSSYFNKGKVKKKQQKNSKTLTLFHIVDAVNVLVWINPELFATDSSRQLLKSTNTLSENLDRSFLRLYCEMELQELLRAKPQETGCKETETTKPHGFWRSYLKVEAWQENLLLHLVVECPP